MTEIQIHGLFLSFIILGSTCFLFYMSIKIDEHNKRLLKRRRKTINQYNRNIKND